MKKIVAVMIAALMAVILFTGCAAQDQVAEAATPKPTATPTATPTPEPTPAPTPEPASVVLMNVPEDQAAAFPVPTAYMALDPTADPTLPTNLPYTLYAFTDINGAVQYRAFGQKLNPADKSFAGEQGWYALTITDEPLSAEAIRKVITFDATAATPVDLTAEAATYAPVPTAEPQDEESTKDSGKAESTKPQTDPAPKAETPSSGGGSSGGSSGGGSSSNEEENLEDRLPDEFEITTEGKEYDSGNGVITYY